MPRQRRLLAAIDVRRGVTLRFVDSHGRSVPASRIDEVGLTTGSSSVTSLIGTEIGVPALLLTRVAERVGSGWDTRSITYSLASVKINGANAVFAGRQRFAPQTSSIWTIDLSVFSMTLTVRDALFGSKIGTSTVLTRPDGSRIDATVNANAPNLLTGMVRGLYTLKIDAAVLGGSTSILVSRDDHVELRVITLLDTVIIAVGGALCPARRCHARCDRHPASPPGRRSDQRCVARGASAWRCSWPCCSPAHRARPRECTGQPSTATATNHVPVYAYFYQWFERSSWDRAKQDFPLAGHYSSDDPHVLRRQIEQARWAGIDGFLTSWKSTDALNRRLRLLLRMAALTHFDVGVVYEALDFYRHPLPIATVLSDLTYLADTWVGSMHSAFGRPVIIWTGTNEYSRADIAAVHRMLAGRAYLLAASKNVADYQRIAGLVDGEAYYWSSANPRSSGTSVKLREMAAAVHAHHGIWICPAAPGFDGRPLGHTRVIDRANGSTFAHSLDVARQSSPSAIGVISWNEWSENTYIEPGRRYGRQELDVLHAYTSSRDTVTHVPASRQHPAATDRIGPGCAQVGSWCC